MLRALVNVEDGFYVDVGAYDPTDESVTRLFYDRGWRGVNIDPSAEAIARFEAERPDEINIPVAAGDRDGEAEFYVSDVPGWSTTDVGVGEGLDGEGRVARRVTVPIRRLSSILDSLPPRTIDFLKIDAEGSESDVIAGLDLTRHRPRVIVLEGVAPIVGDGNIAPALASLVEAGYVAAGFDGLNHYLTAEPELIDRLAAPANPTDGYVRHNVVQMQQSVATLQGQLAALQGRLATLQGQVAALQGQVAKEQAEKASLAAEVSRLQVELSRVHSSWEQARTQRDQLETGIADRDAQIVALTAARSEVLDNLALVTQEMEGIKAGVSWRITAPIRLAGGLVRPGRRPTVGRLLARGDQILRRFPAVRERAIVLIDRSPVVARLARRFVERNTAASRAPTHTDFDAVTTRRESAAAALELRAHRRRVS